MDFQFDSDYQGKSFKICNVINEFTRAHVGFEVARSITAVGVIDLLDNLAPAHGGRPRVLRMDNGPEFISHTLAAWATQEQSESFSPGVWVWGCGLLGGGGGGVL